jgi:hypothetical protein
MGYATSMKISEGVNMSECEHRICVYFEVFHSVHSYICKRLLIVPAKYTMSILCVHFCISPACFIAICIISENYYASYLKPDIVIKMLNMASIAVVS